MSYTSELQIAKKLRSNNGNIEEKIRVAADLIENLVDKLQKYEANMTPSAETKAALIGEFSFQRYFFDENLDEQVEEIVVPWTTIKEIMKAIKDETYG